MDNTLFYKYFHFIEISRKVNWHTDNSRGIPCNFIGRMLSGRAEIVSAEDGTLELSAGDVFYFPFGLKYHSYWYAEGADVRFESYRFDFYPSDLGKRFCLQKLYPNAEQLSVLDLLSADKTVTPLSVGRLFSFFGSLMPSMKTNAPDPRARLFEEAREYISKNLDFKVPKLARHLGMSESGVYAFFRSFATTPIEVKNSVLAERAVALLSSTDLSVEEICGRLGLSSSAYFRKVIRDFVGKSPTEIRREVRITDKI
ncbi:MAG: helix-turn-helix domain-containing protein [Clostridia bacterium]|nr:helix-turn-helix domain-containing protein [Clostridia bacterium]MBR3714332.1 helix-turn-helix domain-containing protein [Clostridia bacterium]